VRVIGYTRVSTTDQAAEGVSLEAQKARLVSWARDRGHELHEADVHTDAGLSGGRADNRPGLQAALEAVCRPSGEGAGRVLVVYSLSRLARSTRDAISIGERLADAGADLVSLSEDLNTTTAAGKMVFRLLAVLAEFERDLISERTRTAHAHKRARGERLGQVPYGCRLAADGKTLVPDLVERSVLADIAEMRGKLYSFRLIAGELTRRGAPTKNGAEFWRKSTVHGLYQRHFKRGDDGTSDANEARPELPAPGVHRGEGGVGLRAGEAGGGGPGLGLPVPEA
jgi:site-specific DNA recombinase